MSQAVSLVRTPKFWIVLIGAPVLFAAALLVPKRPLPESKLWADGNGDRAPELSEGVAWLNTDKPVSIHKDLKGKIVILDFWTFCCINCIHTLPDLAKIEEKYGKQVVVVGVHSPKFEAEKKTENIRKAVLRYQIRHPVVNDAEQKIWDAYQCSSWPTLAVIDPEGNWKGNLQGEGNLERLEKAIEMLIKRHRENKTLNEEPIRFALEKELERPLNFPGKVLADAKSKRLFIADSTNHRIVITDLNGTKIAVAGTGEAGNVDGPFNKAQFNDPQGMCLKDEVLYVADRKNHQIRALDLKAKTVAVAAGVGEQDRENRGIGGSAKKIGMNSPWDLLLGPDGLIYIAMAGSHQIWTLDVANDRVDLYAGDGRENIRDGSLVSALFAQPSGLTTNGKEIFVADSEVSAIRGVSLGNRGGVRTIVGKGLFKFGDQDGKGDDVLLQHALAVQYVDGKLYVADTYNNKIKVLDPETSECKTFVGGDKGGWLTGATFNQPGGLSYADGKLYVADTNASRIRVVDLKTRAVTTLPLKGVPPVVPK